MNIQAMMAQAKKMQADMEKAKTELQTKEITIEKQGIKLVVYGSRKIKTIDINEILIDPEDKEMIEDLLIIAFNEAMDQISILEEQSTPKVPGGLGGMF